MLVTKALRMQTTPIKMSYQTTNARQNIKTTRSQLSMRTENAKITMQSKNAKLLIDQTECFAQLGIKPTGQFSAESANYGKLMLQQGLARIVDQGNRMADIHIKTSPLPDQAVYNAFEQFEKAFNMQTATGVRPKITYVAGSLNINYQPGRVINNSTYQKPQIDYIPGKVDINVAQYNRLDISVIDLKG